MTIEASRRGLCLRQRAPPGRPQFRQRTPSRSCTSIEEGPRSYIERIDVRGNTRTRDYVIRREFDISEGDAYNRALVDRAERRLKNLDFFKSVNRHGARFVDATVLCWSSTSKNSPPASSRCGRLFDRGRLHRRSVACRSATSSDAASIARRRLDTASIRAALVLVHRALFHGPPHRARLRPVLEGNGQQLRVLHHQDAGPARDWAGLREDLSLRCATDHGKSTVLPRYSTCTRPSRPLLSEHVLYHGVRSMTLVRHRLRHELPELREQRRGVDRR